MTKSRIPILFALFNAYINATNTRLLLPDAVYGTIWQRLGLTAAEMNFWTAFRNTWNGYYALYIDLDLRTRGVKDNMRLTIKNFILFGQPLLDMISGKSTATTDDYETFRIKRGVLRDDTRTPVPVPTTHPNVESFNINEPGEHIIRFKDTVSAGRAKPFGVKFCEINYAVRETENPPANVDDCEKAIVTGRSPVTILHANTNSGKRAFYFLRWVNNRGQAGAWSQMFSALIA